MEEKEAVETVNLENVLEYIQEREENLTRATEKLRRNVERIVDMFGNKDWCQVCGGHKSDKRHEQHKFVPKITISLEITDDEAFFKSTDKLGEKYEYVLTIDRSFKDRKDMHVRVYYGGGYHYTMNIRYLPRKAVKEMVKSGRISKFLGIVAKELEEAGKEYEEVAQVAERLAAALPTND